MSEHTLNSYLIIKDALKLCGNKPELVPITRSLIVLAQNSQKNYLIYLEEKRMLDDNRKRKEEEEKEKKRKEAEIFKEVEQERKTIQDREKELKEKMKEKSMKLPKNFLKKQILGYRKV